VWVTDFMTPTETGSGATGRPARLLHDVPLRVLLIGGFLISGLIPLMILSLASYRTAHEELKRQAFRQLEAVRDIKRQQVMHYFQERFADLRVFSATPSMQQAARELSAARLKRDLVGERNLRERHEPYLQFLLKQYDYSGLYLVDATTGSVLLASEKGRATADASGGQLPHRTWQEAWRQGRATLTDIGRYGDGGREVAQYLAVPLARDSSTDAIIIARLSLEPIDRMMKERSGMGLTGETYLVGSDRRMRSDSHLDPASHSVLASLAGTIVRNGADTESVTRSLRGETGTAVVRDYRGIPVLSAFAPLHIEGLAWVIVAEIDVAEIDQQIRQALNTEVLSITAGAALLVLILALIITHFIGRNIGRMGGQLKSLIDDVLHDRMDREIDTRQISVDFRAVAAQANHLVTAFRDHVERIHRLEEHQRFTQKIEAVGTLASGIAHDFNNILTYMLAYARLAMAALPADAPAMENLREIVAGIHRAGELIRRIMPFSQPLSPGRQCTDIRDICRETIAILKATLPKKIVLESALGELKLLVDCAPGSFQQMLMNLCTNAYHAMQDGGGVLTIALTRLEPVAETAAAAAWVRLTVRDSGCGMSAEVRSRLFEPLFTTKPIGIGSGLGLVMVQETVKACHGRIGVTSEPGRGSEFRIDLPLLTTDVAAVTITASAPWVAHKPLRILFVDDEEHIRLSEKQVLEELGFPTDTAVNAEEALRLHADTPGRYQLVITDLNMRGINGVELAERLHHREPNLPIFLTTGFLELLQGIDPASVGIRAVLAKPFDMAELHEALHIIAAL
jgi:signal transduction histidine kinase